MSANWPRYFMAARVKNSDRLIDRHTPRPRPSVGGFRSERPMSAEEIDAELMRGFGE